ncbi:hypothetical protein Ancab_021439 [Ancistrocladus abbreviatus]
MFWRMAGLSTASPVETILDKENFTLEELLDEDEIIQECKALNSRLINYLRERPQVEQLIRYIVEEAPEDAEKSRTFKFPFISCEIFTCEVDIILKTVVEDGELMNLLFSFLDPNRSHSTLLAGYFSKVLICLLLRKTVPLMHYINAHQDIITQLVDLIGITSIMEVLIRLIGADEHIYANYTEAMRWLENTDVLEMIVDKFSSSDSPEVHANAAETLCAITRYAPPGLAAKVSSPSFIGGLFHRALEESRPKSVLDNCLTVCISLLDPKRLSFGAYHGYNRQFAQVSTVAANPEIVEGMLQSLGHLLKLLCISSEESVLLTTYGKLQPPLGKHRLKIVEFVSVLLSIGSEAAEKELIQLGGLRQILDLFFMYPYNNFLHHHVENIIESCLESKRSPIIDHIFRDCDLVGRILEAEKNSTLSSDPGKFFMQPTIALDGKLPPRIGNIGHISRMSNKIFHMGNTNGEIQAFLQENSEWVKWQSDVLAKRNIVENVYQWACGRPTALQDRTRDSDDDDYQDRDYDVTALANNLSQAFRYGIYGNDMDEGHGSLERDDEDVYFDDESAEVVISSLRLADDQESGSIFTNSNWFAFEDDRINDDRLTSPLSSPSPDTEKLGTTSSGAEVNVTEDQVAENAISEDPGTKSKLEESTPESSLFNLREATAGSSLGSLQETGQCETKSPEAVEWRETSSSSDASDADRPPSLPNGTVEEEAGDRAADVCTHTIDPSPSTDYASADTSETKNEDAPHSTDEALNSHPSLPSASTAEDDNKSSTAEGNSGPHECEKTEAGKLV